MPKCKCCKKDYTRTRSGQVVCSYLCAISYSKQLDEKKEANKKKANRKAKRDFYRKDVKTLKQTAQDEVNRYIRLRDRGSNCISCKRPIELFENKNGIVMPAGDAGHFYSAGKVASLRFNVNNIHLECRSCNVYNERHLESYKPNLIAKIGEDRFKELERLSKTSVRFTAKYYQRLIDIARKKIKILEKK